MNIAEAYQMSIEPGVDVELPTTDCCGEPIHDAVHSGRIRVTWVDRAVERHLRLRFDLGLFDQPNVEEEGVAEVFDTPDHA